MPRPVYLVIDEEHFGSISTRKLVLETAKLNVITAYSGAEGLETLARFPAVTAVIVDVGVPDMACKELTQRMKAMLPEMPIVVVGRPGKWDCSHSADHYLESFDPPRLLELLRSMSPQAAEQIEERESELAGTPE